MGPAESAAHAESRTSAQKEVSECAELTWSTGAVKLKVRSANISFNTSHWMSYRSNGSESSFLMACVQGSNRVRGVTARAGFEYSHPVDLLV